MQFKMGITFTSNTLLSLMKERTGITQGMKQKSKGEALSLAFTICAIFVDDPHTGIVGHRGGEILNLADKRADFARSNIVSLAKEKPKDVIDMYKGVSLPDRHDIQEQDFNMKRLGSVLQVAYNREINNFEDLLMMKGVGPRTLKALALTSEVIHGDSSKV